MKRLALALPALLIASTPVLITSPAEARILPRAEVTLAASQTSAPTGDTVKLKGRVKTRANSTAVVLQRRVGAKWTYVDREVASKRYAFYLTAQEGSFQYRVKALRTKYARPDASPTVTITGVSEEAPPETNTDLAQQQALVLQYTNEFRAANGKAPLLLMPELNTVAQNWTLHMAQNDDFRHNPNFFDEYPDGAWGGGENIAYGYPSARAVVNAWIDSPGHRANMLGDYTHLGVGWAEDSNGTDWWTQNFASFDEDEF